MKVTKLELRNFRGLRKIEMNSFDPHINVIVGVNGSGKSSILDCIAVLLSRMFGRIQSERNTGRSFPESDIRNGAAETTNAIKIVSEDDEAYWSVTKLRAGQSRQTITDQAAVRAVAERLQKRLSEDAKANLPLAVYYPVNRAVLDVPLRIKTKHVFDQLSAFDHALTGGRNDFRLFFEWFRDREDIENQNCRRRTNDTRPLFDDFVDRELNAVRKAIETFLPSISDLRIQRSPLRMEATKDGKTVFVNQFSDGEKCMLAMIGDLARRLSISNPSLHEPCHGHAVVLIDEIDLHLHPKWQRLVIPQLVKTFPNCQFIVSTHSPQIVSHLQPSQVHVLDVSNEEAILSSIDQCFGLTSNQILEEIFDVGDRPAEIQRDIKKLWNAIDGGHLDRARKQLSQLQSQIGLDPELVKAGVLIRKKEALQR